MASAAKEISFSDRSSEGFKVVDVGATFGPDTSAEIENWLHEALRHQIDEHANLHKTRIPKLRNIYLGKSKPDSKSFPFADCSNIEIQVVGELVDTITARILGTIWATPPLWRYFYPAVKQDSSDSDEAEKKRTTLEYFMDAMAYDQEELDLKRIYGQWCTEHANLGTSFVKCYVEDSVEAQAVGYTSQKKAKFDEITKNGPAVEKVAHEDVLMSPSAQTVDKSRLVSHIRHLTKYDLQDRVFNGFYDKAAVESILNNPDRQGPTTQKAQENRKKGVSAPQSMVSAEWDVYECYFPWIHAGHKFRLVYSYHLSSRKVLRKIFNPIPKNKTPLIRAKFGYTNDGAYGTGLADLLEDYQKEVSTTHNNRIDNSTLANTRFFRLSPAAVNMGTQVDIFPTAGITANKDDFEMYAMADVYQSSFQNESMTLEEANQRAGIAPAVTGMGSGGMQGKGKNAVYSSGPALAAMQEANHRTNLATSDFRHAHQKLGHLVTVLYGVAGTSGKEEMFGEDSKYLKMALKEYLSNKCRIPMRSADASLNREVEKQNDMLITGVLQRHYTAQSQILQAAMGNPMIPDPVKQYYMEVIESNDRFIKHLFKNFGYDQPEDYIPSASKALKGGKSIAPQAQPQAPNPIDIASQIAGRPLPGLPQQSQGGQGNPTQ